MKEKILVHVRPIKKEAKKEIPLKDPKTISFGDYPKEMPRRWKI